MDGIFLGASDNVSAQWTRESEDAELPEFHRSPGPPCLFAGAIESVTAGVMAGPGHLKAQSLAIDKQ